ncbi:MAG: threonine synthase [Eubacteriales bacterium]
MEYISSRGAKGKKRAAEAIIQGIAADRGLFVPTKFPRLPKNISEFAGMTYKEIAIEIFSEFLTDFTRDEIEYCVNSAYDDKFDETDMVKITNFNQFGFLELYHGKTAAFKDMALSILPYFMRTAMKKEKEERKICILTATSGDTGKAALEGFADVESTEIAVFYPKSGVSDVQRMQMVTQEGANTHVYAIEGNFDDAQTKVKDIFGDSEFEIELEKLGVKLSSANSINIGRLLPQVVYYVYTYVKLLENGKIKENEKINVVVPTGNFGNILAAYYAKKIGTPINKLICASNENNVLTDFFNTFEYDIRSEKRGFNLTNSPSMDILVSSNLERLLYHLCGEDTGYIKSLMNDLENNKHYIIKSEYQKNFVDFVAGYANMNQTQEAIKEVYEKYDYLIDTHTAVAYKVYKDYEDKTADGTFTVIASTASPYKFPRSVANAIGISEQGSDFDFLEKLFEKTKVSIPKSLSNLQNKEVRHKDVIEKNEIKNAVRSIFE